MEEIYTGELQSGMTKMDLSTDTLNAVEYIMLEEEGTAKDRERRILDNTYDEVEDTSKNQKWLKRVEL